MERRLIEEISQQVRADYNRLLDAGLICLHNDFVPAVHYPAITGYPPIKEETLFDGYTIPSDGLLDIYAHIPFCEKHCVFCHYPIKTGTQTEEKERYLGAIEKEMDIYLGRLGIDRVKVRSILIGGGTPTYLAPVQLERFLESFTSRLDMSGITQFNYDLDPATMLGADGLKRLQIMKSYGVDRLTIGAQSLDDRILKIMNRTHDAKDVFEAIERAWEFGFGLNVEFIYGYPEQFLDSWIADMEQIAALDIPEIQLYRLKILPYGDHRGSIGKQYNVKQDKFPGTAETLIMKKIGHTVLEQHGYWENLGRVFSKKRDDYSHYADNQCCMLYDQIGFGLTAFSSLRDRFALNTQHFEEYYQFIENGKLPINRGLVRDPEQQIRWSLILPLKNRIVHKTAFLTNTGMSVDDIFPTKMKLLREHGLIEQDDRFLTLTKLGRFFADEVAQQFYHPDHIPFPKEKYAHGPLNPYNNNSLDA